MVPSGTVGEIDLDVLAIALARKLGAAVHVLDASERNGRLVSLTLRLERAGRLPLDIDVAHVASFERDTWEPALANAATLVGARGRTMHKRAHVVEFRLATWVERFDPDSVASALAERLRLDRDDRKRRALARFGIDGGTPDRARR
jgi:hypothetical protein